ncbi:hypothetical protein E4U42_001345 [Claviceps africana]|uniref:Uncharacterized protein n=1 Tax=Claviceps africana TaxID=83212 RepID=A0A8K0J4I5_9HYPO|nr:hypothetical protein E4U42_001345 [Claviceps africana]
MKSIVALLVMTMAVVAFPRDGHVDVFVRQDVVVDAQTPAMTDKQGNVVPFDAAGVNLANTEAGIE